jgi:hypothetical protein
LRLRQFLEGARKVWSMKYEVWSMKCKFILYPS